MRTVQRSPVVPAERERLEPAPRLVGEVGAVRHVVEQLVQDHEVERLAVRAHELVRLGVDEPEVDRRHAPGRDEGDESGVRGPRRPPHEVDAGRLLPVGHRLERAARELDGDVVDPVEVGLLLVAQPAQLGDRRTRELAVVRSELEDPDPPEAGAPGPRGDQLRESLRMPTERSLGREHDLARDRVVVAGVDLALREPLARHRQTGQPESSFLAAVTTSEVVNG